MYLEINLLPRAFRPKKSLIRLDYKFLAGLVIVIVAAGMVYYYYNLSSSIKRLDEEQLSLRQQQANMQGKIELNEEIIVLEAEVQERIDIIRTLTGDSDLRFRMLEHLNNVLPDNLWLISILEEGGQAGGIEYSIEGMSYSKDKISGFLAGLERFESFASVNLESIAPAPFNVRDAFRFIVRVQLKSAVPVPEEDGRPRSGRKV